MEQKHWQSFGERLNSEAWQENGNDEFREDLPTDIAEPGFLQATTPRRDFLKYLGFSTAAATLAASCEIPVKHAIPFANKPEDIIPGAANYYATTFVQEGEAVSILAKVRDGRPIKIEGNTDSPIFKGGTSARVQASVLDLYDTARLRFPTMDGKESTFAAVDQAIGSALAGAGPVALVTTTVTSRTTKEVINRFLARYPGSRHVQYDSVSYSGMLQANQQSYGVRSLPQYRFDNADVIVSLGADFLGTWLSPIEYTKQYTIKRRIDEKNISMSKHIHFESVASMTGSNADDRYLHRPSEIGAVALALLAGLGQGSAPSISDAKLKTGIDKTVAALRGANGRALVVCGSNDPQVQLVVNAINEAVGANGTTIDWASPNLTKQGDDAAFAQLVNDMNAGSIGAVIFWEANPVYTWFDSAKVVSGIKRCRLSVSFNTRNCETTQNCKYAVPDHNFLESWGDAEPVAGYISLVQPTINPLFKTRQWQDSLMRWMGEPGNYGAFVRQYWQNAVGGADAWNRALQAGLINPATEPAVGRGSYNAGALGGATSALAGRRASGGTEVVFYQKVGLGSGYSANNPWLQELPDPVTRATWDNYVIVSPAMAKTLLDIDLLNGGQADAYESRPAKKVVKVTVNGKTLELPALIIPGTQANTIGIALGYGRSEAIGKAANGVGKNAYVATSFRDNAVQYTGEAKAEVTGDVFDVALTQTHNTYDTQQGNRTEVMKELTLASFKQHPTEIRDERDHELKPWGGLEKYESQGTIYPVYDRPGIKWGMSIDLSTCTGCGACVVACNAENNVAVVGKSEVARFHDMHWLRIDRYYSGDMDNPKVVFQPMLCQHCDNAPCENVCPVAATNHSSEGLNQMTYNRCIGTRYCANNCPYKVRRFNWADYTGADSFKGNQDEASDTILMMNDELTRMVLNPDVTVRSRGVIEKCSFCVQRLQDGKLKAKKEGRPLKTGGHQNDFDVQTACQQACPTDGIIFGNANDGHSAVSLHRIENPNRLFISLEPLHVLPNVTYMAKVRNTDDPVYGQFHKGEEHHEGKGKAEAEVGNVGHHG